MSETLCQRIIDEDPIILKRADQIRKIIFNMTQMSAKIHLPTKN